METKHTTLISPMSENIGQVRIQYAFDEIIRLNEQENTTSWRIDTSDYLFVPDETMREVKNPCPLSNGYVWVTKTRELSKAEKCANELLEALQPFMEFAKEWMYKFDIKNGRPKEGEIYTIDFSGNGAKSITVEMLKKSIEVYKKATE